jgi:hypothetical protein
LRDQEEDTVFNHPKAFTIITVLGTGLLHRLGRVIPCHKNR